MDNDTIIQLREVFRQKFQEDDFCIGQEKVERVFRELLGEAEPETIYLEFNEKHRISKEELEILMNTYFNKKTIDSLFNQDSAFFKNMKRNK